ncbi:MAG TPA: protein kinase [Gemmatimonadaceae bacterium]|jgi:serine/threonine protein kinase/tetratricopeptide (TPR) repeat protein
MSVDLRDHLQQALTNAYSVERELAGGGMSRVFVAEERALGRRVVVKVLSPDLAAGVNVERFRREIQLTARLQHPHIVPILSAGEMDGLPFYTMPFVEGESLRIRLVRTGAMGVSQAVNIVRDVARALEFAHEKGIVHRDIKPDNVLLAGESATVTDFGIGKAIAESRVGEADEALTLLGVALGTPQYMAPEQIAADPAIDHRADLYSLGCVAYELLAGETPFAGRSGAAVFRAHLLEEPAPITAKRSDVHDSLCQLIAHCLAKDPALRPTSAREVLALLERVSTVAGSSATGAAIAREALTIAVLPFANVNADPESEHFADGLTDEVITDLSMLKMLRVTSRQSAMRLKGSDKDVRTIARELGTRFVLTGSVRRAGANLRVTAQLVDATSDAQVWAEKYSGTLDDVFDIQEKLSRHIVEALRLRLTPDEDQRMAERPIRDVRAYEYYLLARQQIWSFTRPSLERGLQLIRQAQAIVGESELLLAAEGLIYWQYVNVGLVPVERYDVYLQKADACAARMLELNPRSAKAHSLRGAVRMHRADPRGAMEDFKRALVFDRNDPEALLWLGYGYAVAGRVALGRALMERLQQVDPLTSINQTMFGIIAMLDGKYDEALCWTQRSVDVDPGNPTTRMMHAHALAANGRVDDARGLLHTVASEKPTMAWARLACAMAFALTGDREQVLTSITPDLRDAAATDDIFSWWMADCYALVGERDAALECVARMIDLGLFNYPFLAQYEPFIASIRAEPRFASLLEQARKQWDAFEP